jgi:hypothetical protein
VTDLRTTYSPGPFGDSPQGQEPASRHKQYAIVCVSCLTELELVPAAEGRYDLPEHDCPADQEEGAA